MTENIQVVGGTVVRKNCMGRFWNTLGYKQEGMLGGTVKKTRQKQEKSTY